MMSERLNQLATRLAQMGEGVPVDVRNTESTLILMAKCQAYALAKSFQNNADDEEKRESAQAALNVSNEMAKTVGAQHKAVKILRGMGLIATASLEGKPEPSDETLGLASRCFVATACYGSADCPELIELRLFRDEVLLASDLGRMLVAFYYSVAPSLAKWISKSSARRRFARDFVVSPIARMVYIIHARVGHDRRRSL